MPALASGYAFGVGFALALACVVAAYVGSCADDDPNEAYVGSCADDDTNCKSIAAGSV